MAPTCSKITNELRLPLGTQYKITYKSKSKRIKEAIIVPGPDKRVFYALFKEDDVDWKLIVNNKLCTDRKVRTTITTGDDGRRDRFITDHGKPGYWETLESNGKKFHFLEGSSLNGQVVAAAKNRGTDYSETQVLVSRLELTVDYGWSEKELKSKPIKIYVNKRSAPGETYELTRHTFNVTGSTTLADLRKLVKKKFGVMPQDQTLYYSGLLDTENKCMFDYKICNGATIFLHVLCSGLKPRIIIYFSIKMGAGKTIPIESMYYDTVENIKFQIQGKEGIPPDQQRLIFAGRQLEEGRELSWYGIRNGCVVNLVWSLYDQEEHERKFTRREDILPENFIIELRMVPK